MSDTIKTIIVDDESLARRGLSLRLQQFPEIEVLALCENGRQAVSAIAELNPDLVFLDIQMPGMDGFEVIKALQTDALPLIVFVTAFDQYAVDAFQIHALDYLLKPIEDARLHEAVGRVRSRLQEQEAFTYKDKLFQMVGQITGSEPQNLNELEITLSEKSAFPESIAIKDGSTVTIVATQEIDWIDAAGDYMCIHVGDDIHIMRATMKQLETQLDPAIFQRVHRSTIVNLSRVKQVCSHINSEYHLVLTNGARLKMSRTFKDKVKHFL